MHQFVLQYRQIGDIFDFLSAGVILLSGDQKVLHMNRTAEQLTGLSPKSTQGRYCFDAFAGYLCDGDCIFQESVASRHQVLSRQFPVDRHDRSSLQKIVSPIYGPGGRLDGCIEIFQDTSAFTDLIRRVGEESRKLKTILDHLDIGVFTCDRGGHITFFNRMAEEITGFSKASLLGKTCRAIFNDAFCDLAPVSIASGENGSDPVPSTEIRIDTGGGGSVPVRARSIAMGANEDQPLGRLITFSDMSLLHEYKQAVEGHTTFHDMIGAGPAMQTLFDIIPPVAESDTTVLIEGPTGSGKDLLARVIHSASNRAEKPLVKVNCAALPDNLLESEMFGYVRGAFTGADRDKPGRFQEADGGTIFLDEIGDLPLPLQAKLLRVLEDQEFYPLGSRKIRKVDVRIISATNAGLQTQVAEKRFREDLFYRLNVMRLELPPLKQRREDIPLLIRHLQKKLTMVKERRIDHISESAMETLLNYTYPGNIRELENILEHALIVCRGPVIDRCHLPQRVQEEIMPAVPAQGTTPEPTADEKETIHQILIRCDWCIQDAADALDINRTTLWRKMKKYNIQKSSAA